MKKLTRAQQEVVELLKTQGATIDGSRSYNILVRVPNDERFHWFIRSTFNALLRLNIIKPTYQKDIYVLSEKE